MTRRVDAGWRALAEARLTLRAFRGGVDRAIARVPVALHDNPGLVYERLRWRRRKGRDDEAYALLNPPPDDLIRPEIWWRERAVLVRRALEQGEISRAYRLTLDHGLLNGAAWADAEWLGGWIALRFLADSDVALRHFAAMYEGVRYPISKARAAYWAGRAAEAAGDDTRARDWYARAAVHVTTYYGQLAAQKLPVAARPRLAPPPAADAAARDTFADSELVRLVRQLAAIGESDRLGSFFAALIDSVSSGTVRALVVALAEEIGHPEFAVAAGKRATRHGVPYLPGAYPQPDIAPTDGLEPEFRLAVIRQESAFDAAAVSPAGARGLMQLMPATARRVARQQGVRYVRARLTRDTAYNLRLGSAYLADLLRAQKGSYVLALAAYNAGPTRARRWIRAFGDPRDFKTDVIDWIESIPLSETRDYVQRVMGNLQIYRLRANGEAQLALTPESDLHRSHTVPGKKTP
ncbi:MAG: lytic transglycosylase domain-containing protein [Alphaproteobacteria bacterium]